jgi:hypothetical protein
MKATCSRNLSNFSLVILLFLSRAPLLRGYQCERWTQEELALAKELGLEIEPDGKPFRWRSIGEQTWMTPWVVEGTVQGIDKDLYGVYHTKVKFHVESYLKGSGPADITIGYTSGEAYSEHYKGTVIIGSPVGSASPLSSQDVGNRVVLFLDKASAIPYGQEDAHKRADMDFSVKNHYLITDGCACPDTGISDAEAFPGTSALSELEIVAQVLRIAVPQARLATGGSKPLIDGEGKGPPIEEYKNAAEFENRGAHRPSNSDTNLDEKKCRDLCNKPETIEIVVQDGRIGVQASNGNEMERRLLPAPRPEGPLTGIYQNLPEIGLIALKYEQVVRAWEPIAADWTPGLWWLTGSSTRGKNLVLTQERADLLVASIDRVEIHASDHLARALGELKEFIRNHVGRTLQEMRPELFVEDETPSRSAPQ